MAGTRVVVMQFRKKPKAVVLNLFMSVLGGGERSALVHTMALDRLGYDAELITTDDAPDTDRMAAAFGGEFKDVRIVRMPHDAIMPALHGRSIDLFVNHTFGSFVRNCGRMGIYVQMFPAEPVRRSTSPYLVAALETYHRMSCVSSFSRDYTLRNLDFPPERISVLNPPLDAVFSKMATRWAWRCPPKKRQFVNVGRFNPSLHNKNQLILIEAFLDARSRFRELEDWSFLLIGHVNRDVESQQYFAQCAELAGRTGGAVRLEADASLDRVVESLGESFGYVHGAGAFIQEAEHPEMCEHFGIAIAEAMACGCVPLIYHAGGIFDVFTPGRGGLSYHTYRELVDGFATLASVYGTTVGRRMQRFNVAAVGRLSERRFIRNVGRVCREIRDQFRLH